jgi:hypothetical protein
MAVNATSALAGTAAGLEQPAHDPSKDDDGFDSAFGVAMFAMPSSLAMPAWNITHAQQKSAGSADAAPADGVAATDVNRQQATTSSDASNLVAVSDPVGACSRFASANAASLEKLADLAPGSESADGSGALRGAPLDNQKSSVQAANAEAPQVSADTTVPDFFKNIFDGALGGKRRDRLSRRGGLGRDRRRHPGNRFSNQPAGRRWRAGREIVNLGSDRRRRSGFGHVETGPVCRFFRCGCRS